MGRLSAVVSTCWRFAIPIIMAAVLVDLYFTHLPVASAAVAVCFAPEADARLRRGERAGVIVVVVAGFAALTGAGTVALELGARDLGGCVKVGAAVREFTRKNGHSPDRLDALVPDSCQHRW